VTKTTINILLIAGAVMCCPTYLSAQKEAKPQAEEVEVKKKFAHLKSAAKKSMMTGLRLIEKGKVDEEEGIDEVSDGIQLLVEIGEGVIPKCLTSFPRIQEVGRLAELLTVLDKVLVDHDLSLALSLSNRKTPDEVYAYLLRRWADSSLDDAVDQLTEFFERDHPEIKYQCVRGLMMRGKELAVEECVKIIDLQWKDDKQQLRADFSGLSRGIMSELIEKKLTTANKKARLLGLHLFELFGLEKDKQALADNLSNSDTALRLGAINACRVVIANEPPLMRPSMTELIELATAWSAKI
jgi:hypothetical protein